MRNGFYFLMRHLILILIFLYLAAGFIYRHEIFGLEPDNPSQPETAVPLTPSVTGQDEKTALPPDSAEEKSETEYQFRPQEPEEKVAIDPNDQQTLDKRLQSARALVEAGDFNGAEAAYLEMTKAFPVAAAPHGELGNLYLSQQQKEKAAEAYYEAGMRVDYESEPRRMDVLIQALQQLSPERAAMLKHHMGLAEKP